MYVPVEAFAAMVGVKFTWDGENLTFNGKPVTYDFEPRPHRHDDRAYVPVPVLASLAGGVTTHDAKTETANVLALPAGVIKLTPVVPAMDEHWADPKTMPLGPIYGVHNSRLIFLEFMMSQDDFKAGKSWTELSGIPEFLVNNVPQVWKGFLEGFCHPGG